MSAASMHRTAPRPFGVGLVSLLILISGVVQVIGGLIIFTQRDDDQVLTSLGTTSSEVTRIAVVAIVVGALGILIGGALRSGARWARTLVAVLAVLNVASLVWGATSLHSVHWYNVMWPAVISALTAGYLFFDDDAKAFFG